jgi:hypothetical protein
MIADHLEEYYRYHGRDPGYDVRRSIMVGDHECAWVAMLGTTRVVIGGDWQAAGQPFVEHTFLCECAFTRGVGWELSTEPGFEGPVDLTEAEDCPALAMALSLRHAELRAEYRRQFCRRPSEPLTDHAREVVLDLIAKTRAGEFIGGDHQAAELWGGYFYTTLLAGVLDVSPAKAGELAVSLMRQGVIGLNGLVITPPRPTP